MNVRPDMVMCISGQPVWFQHPEHTKLSWDDLDVYLSNLNRYNGGIPWNLAQHHWLCHDMVHLYSYDLDIPPPWIDDIEAELVVHDIHETVVGDVVAGLKPFCPDYKKIEGNWEDYFWKFLYPNRTRSIYPAFVKNIDQRAVVIEAWWGAPALYNYFIKKDPSLAVTQAEKALVNYIGSHRKSAVEEMKSRIARHGGYIGS